MNADSSRPSPVAVQVFGPAWLQSVAWLPVPLILAALILLWHADLQTAYERPYLLISLNFFFSVLASLLIAHLIAKSFQIRGTVGLLMIGCGVVIWGTAAFVGISAGLSGKSSHDFDNISITIHNTSVLLAGICFLAGVVLSFRPRRIIRSGGLALLVGYTCSLGAVGFVTLLALGHLTPTFFVQGAGGTSLRWFVLSSSAAMFAFSAVLVRVMNRRSPSQFYYWYGLALALIATGLFGIMIEKIHGGALSWVGRGAQLLSGVYMLIATVASVRENRVWGIPLEEALQESEKQYKSLFNSMTEGFALHELIIDDAGKPVDYRFLDINPAFEHLTGLKKEDVVGKTHNEILPGDDPTWVHKYGEVALTGVPAQFENYSPALKRWFQVYTYRPASRRFAVTFMDITDRKRVEAALGLTQASVDGAAEMVAWFTSDGRVYYVNDSTCRTLGYTHEELLKMTALDFSPNFTWEQYEDHWRDVRNRKSVTLETTHRRKDGTEYPAEVLVNYVVYGGREFIFAYGHDITERKRAEAELRLAKEELELRVSERTQELATRAEQLRALAGELTLTEQRERSRLANLLHDHLQQLLVASKFRLTVLSRSRDDVVTQAAKEVEELLDESITASRFLTAELSPPILHQAGLNEGLQWLARRMADTQGLFVDLELNESGPLPEDLKILLFHSIRELLFNVVKHAKTRSAVVNLRHLDGSLQVTVSDQGLGFDPAAMPLAGEGGRGFGLLGIQERLKYMGGTLEIESNPGQGSRFILSVPVIPAAKIEPMLQETLVLPEAHLMAAQCPDPGPKIRVMLADDHAIVRQGIANLLADEPDIEVVGQAADGQEAVELAAKLLPDIILMDVSMPKLSGVEATRIIRNKFPDTRIIGLSMFEDVERAQSMRDAGAVDYITKSGPENILINAIRASIHAGKKVLTARPSN